MKELRLFIDEMQATSSSLDKVAILKRQSKFIQKVLEYTYNPYKQYHLTSKTLIKNQDIVEKTGYFDLFYLLINFLQSGHLFPKAFIFSLILTLPALNFLYNGKGEL